MLTAKRPAFVAPELPTAVVATGGLASVVLAESRTITQYEPDLTLIGLRLVFEKNV